MKFVHIADMHFDSPFVNLASKENLGQLRRLDQRKALKKVIEYIKENKIEFLFIAGDLYEQKYIRKSTIEYINNLFKQIPETKIFITPGNHDPFIKNSYYNEFLWSENVKIFNSKIEKIELEDIDIYGYGFSDFYCKNSGIEEIEIENKNKINILITHGSLDASSEVDAVYNPIKTNKIKEKEFDYVALGHIHKSNYSENENQNIIYPGSTISLGFDEIGKHGMIVGNLEKEKLNLEFIPLDEKEFNLYELDVTQINSKEELIEKINEKYFEKNNLIEIILTGKRNFEINKYELYKLISNEQIIKIKNNSEINYDLEKIANDTTLKGLFAKEMLEKIKKTENNEEKKMIEKAIEIGLEALK